MFRRVAYRFLPSAAALSVATRSCATNAVFNNNNNNNNNNAMQRPRRPRRGQLPPAFDVVHWNMEDATKGHLLRVLHRDSFIVLDYHRQRPVSASGAVDAEADHADEEAEEGGAAPTNAAAGGNRAERLVSVSLPPSYIARFLGVLEGRMDRVEITSRYTNATFAPEEGKAGQHCYVLQATSTRPLSGQQQTADGADLKGDAIEWVVHFDAAESLMLHRFLSQALQYNTGFARSIS